MVETRRKKAAAAQDGSVKEKKVDEPPTVQKMPSQQSQTPTKRGRRGRPPKFRPETSVPSTSINSSQEDDLKHSTISIDFESQESCESALANEMDLFPEKEDDDEELQLFQNGKTILPEKLKIPPPPTLTKRRSSNKIKSNLCKSPMKPEEDAETKKGLFLVQLESSKIAVAQEMEKTEAESGVESTSVSEPGEVTKNFVSEVEPVSSTSIDDVAAEAPPHQIESSPDLELVETESMENIEQGDQIAVANSVSSGVNSVPDSESMDIADSESDCGGDDPSAETEDVPTPATSSASSGRESFQQNEPPNGEIHVDVAQGYKQSGLTSWEKSEKASSLTSPQRRIHFLHPAYQSFASTEAQSEPAPLRETENGYSMGFKPMSLKTGKIGTKSNPLIKVSPLDQSVPNSLTSPTKSAAVKRNSNFGETAASILPPPQMVELPKLSFFNPPTAISAPSCSSSASSREVDTSSEKKPVKKSVTPSSASVPAPPISVSRIAEAEKIQAVKAKAERVAQDIARRHVEDRYKDDRDDHDRRREERERRHKKAEEEKQREEDRRAREREKEREIIKKERLEREEARREEERNRDAERRLREEEQRVRDEERRQKEEERKRKEDDERKKADEMKVPEYELINECKFLIKSANKKKTESLLCDCFRSGGNCSDNTCVNRAMNTECPSSCPAKCKNQRFTKRKYSSVEAFHTGTAKGCGLRALKDIKKGRFIIEYVGEVVERDDYEKRKMKYAADKKHTHHYLCDTGVYTIDATVYGNPSRFVNHSCDPNAVCERWSVPKTPGDVNRVGFFAKRNIKSGEEITFDYQFVNYGRDAQQCFCGSSSCNGWIGSKPEEFSSEDEDDDDIITTRHINMDEEEEEKLEALEYLAPHEKIKLIDEMLSGFPITSRKSVTKVITIATKMTDYAQRENLIKAIFSTDTSIATQQFYAKEGMATLIGEWLYADDYSLGNLKLVQTALQALHNDVFVSCAKSDPLLLEVLTRWINASHDGWVDLHVVTNSIVSCVAEREKNYSQVCEETEKEIMENFKRVKEMAFRLNHHWFNRSVSFKIPKKIRQPEPKESDNKPPSSEVSRISSPPYQRHHHSSYFERDSHPRFFNNGNDVHQYRFGGYHGNNYMANYNRRPPHRESYRDRRRFQRRSRSRSRSPSPQMYKRRKLEERESRYRSPCERRGASPVERSPESPESVDKFGTRSEPKIHPTVSSSGSLSAVTQEERRPTTPLTEHYDASAHGIPAVPAVPYPMPGYEAYGMYDPSTGMYVYPAPSYYPAPAHAYAAHHQGIYAFETLPTNQRLREIYERASVEDLAGRLAQVEEDIQQLQQVIARKQTEMAAAEEARREAENELRRRAEENRSKYTWAKAVVADTGEVYYYNKITKETQWSPPSVDQGLLDPNDFTSPDALAVIKKEHADESEIKTGNHVTSSQKVNNSIVTSETANTNSRRHDHSVERSDPASTISEEQTGNRKNRDRERDRDRRDSSRHKENAPHSSRSSDSSRVREFKLDFERVVRSAVKSACREVRNATPDKVAWLIKMVTKDLYKRETSRPEFDLRMSESTERKIRNYTKSLIERKLKTDDLWKGYSDR